MHAAEKLGLGGHTFIEQLGNDPAASFSEQCAIVNAAVDAGIRTVDTTYYQERVALGRVLRATGQRERLHVMAWNFFKQPGHEADLVPPIPYEPEHLDLMLHELQTDYLDVLVVHTDENPDILNRQLALAERWRADGKVRAIGLGMAHVQHLRALPLTAPIDRILTPYNAFNRASADLIQVARERGLKVIALSPFIRGWKLDEIGEDTSVVADVLLRWVTAQSEVNQVIVSMRKSDWVQTNVRSVARGPLTSAEQSRLNEWIARVPGPPKGHS